MSGKIVNLRLARKRKAREDAAGQADRNAARHGLSAEQKSLARALSDKDRRDLDGKKRD